MVEKDAQGSGDHSSLHKTVKKSRFKTLGELHREWTEAGVSTSRATTHRCHHERSYNCASTHYLHGIKRAELLLSCPKSSFQRQ